MQHLLISVQDNGRHCPCVEPPTSCCRQVLSWEMGPTQSEIISI